MQYGHRFFYAKTDAFKNFSFGATKKLRTIRTVHGHWCDLNLILFALKKKASKKLFFFNFSLLVSFYVF